MLIKKIIHPNSEPANTSLANGLYVDPDDDPRANVSFL